jgi:hypothetical protein
MRDHTQGVYRSSAQALDELHADVGGAQVKSDFAVSFCRAMLSTTRSGSF